MTPLIKRLRVSREFTDLTPIPDYCWLAHPYFSGHAQTFWIRRTEKDYTFPGKGQSHDRTGATNFPLPNYSLLHRGSVFRVFPGTASNLVGRILVLIPGHLLSDRICHIDIQSVRQTDEINQHISDLVSNRLT